DERGVGLVSQLVRDLVAAVLELLDPRLPLLQVIELVEHRAPLFRYCRGGRRVGGAGQRRGGLLAQEASVCWEGGGSRREACSGARGVLPPFREKSSRESPPQVSLFWGAFKMGAVRSNGRRTDARLGERDVAPGSAAGKPKGGWIGY